MKIVHVVRVDLTVSVAVQPNPVIAVLASWQGNVVTSFSSTIQLKLF